jgi:hypothetical protein
VAEVFINYRTGDGDEAAELVTSSLSDRFGEEHVFKASHSLQPGELFPQRLIEAARRSEVLLAVMGPEWPLASQLLDEDDWVRKEILAALSTGASVVPVLKGRNTDRLVRADLPPELRWLADVHSLRLDMHDSPADLSRIGDFLADLVPTLKATDRSVRDATAEGSTINSANNIEGGNVVQGRDFTGDMRNVNLNDSRGPTAIGDNNTQNNFLTITNARLRALQARLQQAEHLARLKLRFLRPPGFDGAAATLAEHGIVILDGPPGSGRTAAAQILLFESRSEDDRLHELLPQIPDDEIPFNVAPDRIAPGDRAWVNLSAAEPRLWAEIQGELPSLHARTRTCNARLVIVMPHHEELRSDFRLYRKRIERLPQREVFSHLLRVEGLPSDNPALSRFMADTRSMEDIRQYVGYVLDAKDQTGGDGRIENWVAIADEWASQGEKQVSGALALLKEARQRALLLSVALLHGAHANVVDRTATALLSSLHGEFGVPLEHRPLGERLREIGAEFDAAGYVRFTRPRYESAVRDFFWLHFPELHDIVPTLVRTELDSADLSDRQRKDLARGFTDLCLEQRYQALWKDLVDHLTLRRRNLTSMRVAAAILEHGLLNEKCSRTFRRQVYDWSWDNDTSATLAEVLVAACETMAYTHADEALVRLHHLARRHPRRVGARDALAELARSDPWLLGLLLSRLTRRSLETAWEKDADIFLDVADASHYTSHSPTGQPLIEQGQVPHQLTAGWALAFRRPGKEWASHARDWLRCAAEDETNRHLLVDVLVDGARQDAAVLPQLYGIAHRAAFRDVIADLVLTKISAVQGVQLS